MPSKLKTFLANWTGLFLGLISAVSTIWLGATNQLDLYIHPRYIIFTMAFAAVLLVGIVIAIWLKVKTDTPESAGHVYWISVLALLSFVIILILPPATLTTASVSQRGLNASGTTQIDASLVSGGLFDNTDYKQLSVKDWSALLLQSKDPSFFTGKSADLIGFVNPDKNDPENIFYVARFVISCCAVDAQPIGVPIYMPGWKEQFKENDWVHVEGEFILRQYYSDKLPSILQPSKVEAIAQPENPYVY